MGVSRFPRDNYPVAPRLLNEILSAAISIHDMHEAPVQGLRLCDLGSGTWHHFTPDVCRRLADLVVDQVRSVMRCLPKDILNRRLPRLPDGVELNDVELEVRTYNCLRREGLLRHAQKLGDRTIGDLIALPGFGARCLVDLLTSLEVWTASLQSGSHLKLGSEGPSHMTLEEELFRIASANAGTERNGRIAALYFGWDGGGGCTLREASTKFGISRERVRQVCHGLVAALEEEKPLAPVMDRALELVFKHVPGIADEIEVNLALQGLTRGVFRLEGLRNAAGLLGREIRFAIITVNGRRLATHREATGLADIIVQIARKTVEHWGITTIAAVRAQASKAARQDVNEALARRVLSAQTDFQWLDEAGGWFWLASVRRNPLLNQIEKIVSVAEKISTSELQRGIARYQRRIRFSPPTPVLLELCRQFPAFKVENHMIIADTPLKWKDILSEVEQIMVQVMKDHGPVMQRAKFEEACLSLGMNRATFLAYLAYSPIFARYERGMYGLRGSAGGADAGSICED